MPRLFLWMRSIMGALFIVSALLKANDPLGLTYKIEEFFAALSLSTLSGLALVFAITIVIIEVVLGLALLLGILPHIFFKATLAINICFLALTAYATVSGKIKSCGCFGDCFPISATVSFIKDILLTAFNAFLLYQIVHNRPLCSLRSGLRCVGFVGLGLIGICICVLYRGPFADCLAFTPGTDIKNALTRLPAAQDQQIYFHYSKDGKSFIFRSDSFPEDFDDSYVFEKREERTISTAHTDWVLKDFKLFDAQNQDLTRSVLDLPHCVLLFVRDFAPSKLADLQSVFAQVNNHFHAVPIFVVVRTHLPDLVPHLPKPLQGLYCDNTLMKTIARTSLVLYEFKFGKIIHKISL